MQIDYSKYSDEELIGLVRNKDTGASDYLVNKYKSLAGILARAKFIPGADMDDTIQEGMIGLFKAIRDYEPGNGASFATFANLCISRQISTAIESSNRQKNIPLNTYISFYADDKNEDGEDSRSLIDEYVDESTMSPEQVLIDMENTRKLEEEIKNSLSKFEQDVLELHLAGVGYVDIAKALNRDPKSCDNALQRIRGKIKKIVEK